jgi:hypothetical protein
MLLRGNALALSWLSRLGLRFDLSVEITAASGKYG